MADHHVELVAFDAGDPAGGVLGGDDCGGGLKRARTVGHGFSRDIQTV